MTTLPTPRGYDLALCWSIMTRRSDGTTRLDREWAAFTAAGAATLTGLTYLLHVTVLAARTTLGLTRVGRHAARHGRRHANSRAVGSIEVIAHYVAAALTWTVHGVDGDDRSALSRAGRVLVSSTLATLAGGALWLLTR